MRPERLRTHQGDGGHPMTKFAELDAHNYL
jgi:hypothetical protein